MYCTMGSDPIGEFLRGMAFYEGLAAIADELLNAQQNKAENDMCDFIKGQINEQTDIKGQMKDQFLGSLFSI